MEIGLEQLLLNKISDAGTLKLRLQDWQCEGKKVVFTNGVFDLLHIGHLTYLSKAATLGDKLIVGLNADSSVKRIKGEDRPVNDQNSRAALLASLFFVDAVVVFTEDDPLNLINKLMPDILVKGADYSVESIIGAREVIANGGEVKTIDFVSGYSSTSIIEKIRNQIPDQLIK
ncbi:D-glycero-beta-D-manno-heptose 1-phosphate adenylyltransferase [Mucilaginibacter sabulilitoris]|uniref:D-glycero-beta-D-manno-heptose 1-phosphate adenylyltransferase n=1 Tax=Mucilaginibacter sabulilitoris TaxID=1173583 RepID=A0ABZ0TJP5_9SPHI|nr:D-glycero-beta-D-manno-heptose 1-phosphate adenylyltransferase [Mucilaginibacter sabulilitoris]WPU92418.1 D-glycero-beta-D-manno-heptose 1-phosphate adenylyltransferase [Mucilaginibacter sabulilitoris]